MRLLGVSPRRVGATDNEGSPEGRIKLNGVTDEGGRWKSRYSSWARLTDSPSSQFEGNFRTSRLEICHVPCPELIVANPLVLKVASVRIVVPRPNIAKNESQSLDDSVVAILV